MPNQTLAIRRNLAHYEIVTEPFARRAAAPLNDLLDRDTAVLLHGPRSAGKRTLAAMAADGFDYEFFDLADPAVRAAASADPAGFVWDLPPLAVVEEIQNLPALMEVVAAEALRNPAPGRFLMTTSVSVPGALPIGITSFRVDPLSQEELGGWESGFLSCLLEGAFEAGAVDRLGYELLERIVDGGFADAVLLATPGARGDWYRALAAEIVDRDIGESSRLRAPGLLVDVLQHASATTGASLNSAALAVPFGVSRPTMQDYIGRLARAHLIDLLPAWESEASTRLVSSPRLHVVDTGIAAALQGLTADALGGDRTQLHPLLRTFIYQELRRQAVARPDPLTLTHLRDRDGASVDVVVERADGALAGVCARVGGTVTARDFRGLRRLRSIAGDRFVAGVVLYDGVSTVAYGDGLFAVPVRSLWELD